MSNRNKSIREGFPSTPPYHMLPPPDPSADGPNMGWGRVGGNTRKIPYGYTSILDIGCWIYIYIYMCQILGDKSVHLVKGISQRHRINKDLEIVELKGLSPTHRINM